MGRAEGPPEYRRYGPSLRERQVFHWHRLPRPPHAVSSYRPITPMRKRTIRVSTTETAIEPAQPSRLEKKKNIATPSFRGDRRSSPEPTNKQHRIRRSWSRVLVSR